jgi:hypothetical protein
MAAESSAAVETGTSRAAAARAESDVASANENVRTTRDSCPIRRRQYALDCTAAEVPAARPPRFLRGTAPTRRRKTAAAWAFCVKLGIL